MKNALGHIGIGLIIMVPFAIAGHPWIGWACQSFYWLGRERRDHEIASRPDDLAHTGWYRGWNVLRWSYDGQKDLYAPVVAVAAVVWLLQNAPTLGVALGLGRG